jgi:hypothetical protein
LCNDLTFLIFVKCWLLFSVFGECAKICQLLKRSFIGSIFQPCEMASYIRAVREQNAIKILSLPDEKIHFAYSPYGLLS